MCFIAIAKWILLKLFVFKFFNGRYDYDVSGDGDVDNYHDDVGCTVGYKCIERDVVCVILY